jgi:predicted glycogen debranching enzyme
MMLNRIGELVGFEGEALQELSVNQFDHGFHPRGDRLLERFDFDTTARWRYEVLGARIDKELLLCWGRNVAGVRYRIDPGPRGKLDLTLIPFVSLRDFHAVERAAGHHRVEADGRRVAVFRGDVVLHLGVDQGSFIHEPDWWRGHFYALDGRRGQEAHEDLFKPGRFVIPVAGPTTLVLWASTESVDSLDFDAEVQRHAQALNLPASLSPIQSRLHRAAADFIVARNAPDGSPGTTVLAGYPWFADWGRDTFISLPGLMLTTRRFEQARQVLKVFAEYVSEGMIPNRFDDYTNEPHYNTVDASLWFIHAAHEYVRLSGDRELYDQTLRKACDAILDGYTRGTRFGIRMDESDGLITQGDADTQLTWMDAKCDGIAFTPRQGKAVEINALWHHALVLMGRRELADRVKASFTRVFWISPFRGLYDVVNGNEKDAQVRPNQIFAVSLPNSPLSRDQQHAVVEIVRRELLTPYGLRTLGPKERNFHPYYSGPARQRDEAYHNGTIWPWLLGAFLEAYLRVHDRSPASIELARKWLMPLVDLMETGGCVGQIAEIHEAAEPHRPEGCPAQAWSVAEVLRLAHELEL